MPPTRPTFDESWYRVAALRPRLRSLVEVVRQSFRGEIWFVFRDPANNQFFRVREAGYHLIGLLDGKRSVADAWKLATDQLGDDAPTQGETIQLLGQLYTSNLLAGEMPPDAEGMFDRFRKRQGREIRGYLTNLLFARVPLFDPDRLLNTWVSVFGWLFGPVGIAMWLMLIGYGLWTAASHYDALWDQRSGVLAPTNLPLLYVAFGLTKALHELGHGIACKYFGQRESGGGEVHTIGLMLLVLMPAPYVDASSAWSFRSKWRRAFVGAAGMYVELALAAVAMIVWANVSDGHAIRPLAYNTIFIASFTTILFNANPLIRFDGYYMLADVAEIPNLNQRAKDYLYYLVKRYAYAVRNPRNPANSRYERVWFVAYGIASAIYRVFLFTGIILFVADKLFFLGTVLAAVAVIGWFAVPMGKFAKYLLTSPELGRTRQRAVLVSTVAAIVVLAGLGLIPLPDHAKAQGTLWSASQADVHMPVEGFLTGWAASGTNAAPDGPPLLTARNAELQVELEQLLAREELLQAQYRKARTEEIASAQVAEDLLATVRSEIERVRKDLAHLEVTSPVAGVWIAPEIDQAEGAFMPRGEPVGQVWDLAAPRIRVPADQYLGPLINPAEDVGMAVEVRLPGQTSTTIPGVIERIHEAGRNQLPSAALGFAGGGDIATAADSRDGLETEETFFEIVIRIDPADAPDLKLWPKRRAVVRFDLGPRPAAEQAWRSIRQLLQRRLRI